MGDFIESGTHKSTNITLKIDIIYHDKHLFYTTFFEW